MAKTATKPGKLDSGKTRNLQQKAYDVIKGKIMNRELKPGRYLTDSQLAAELGISRTPVREAFRLLEHEGFLISRARKGWQVYSLALKDIHEIFDIKETLESLMARKAAACKDAKKRAQLKSAMDRMKKAALANNHEAWREADVKLHDILFGMSGNERASRAIRELNEQWYRVRLGLVAMQGRVERSNGEHEAVIEKILSGDEDGAERCMRDHLHNLREELEHLLVNMVLPFVENGI
ncbi:MAG: GntR family transcriptional regulator [Deltaproteobacteria bacterium]|nr:GntR family transcriptional regulator [Deltaproteobacteria bacterium]